MKPTALFTAMLGVAALPALAAQQDFHWQGKLASGATIEIRNVNGGINAIASDSDQVEVSAVKTATRGDPATVRIEIAQHEGHVTICAVYGRAGNGQPCEGHSGRHDRGDVKVAFAVKVPAGVRFVGRTVNGDVRAAAIKADAEGQTVNGNVEIDASGAVRASAVNGDIEARLGRSDWKGVLKLATVNGRIAVTLPGDANTEVKASTVSGSIETDFPLTVSGRYAQRTASGTIGAGGRSLELSAVHGSIELRKAGRVRASSRAGRR
jgi:hypothetical protein